MTDPQAGAIPMEPPLLFQFCTVTVSPPTIE